MGRSSGNETVTVVPELTRLRISMVPPSIVMILLQMLKPRPVPGASAFSCANGTKRRELRKRGDIPLPVSVTVSTTSWSLNSSRTLTLPCVVYFIAFPKMFMITRRTAPGCVMNTQSPGSTSIMTSTASLSEDACTLAFVPAPELGPLPRAVLDVSVRSMLWL